MLHPEPLGVPLTVRALKHNHFASALIWFLTVHAPTRLLLHQRMYTGYQCCTPPSNRLFSITIIMSESGVNRSIFPCPVCEETFASPEEVILHGEGHDPALTYQYFVRIRLPGPSLRSVRGRLQSSRLCRPSKPLLPPVSPSLLPSSPLARWPLLNLPPSPSLAWPLAAVGLAATPPLLTTISYT